MKPTDKPENPPMQYSEPSRDYATFTYFLGGTVAAQAMEPKRCDDEYLSQACGSWEIVVPNTRYELGYLYRRKLTASESVGLEPKNFIPYKERKVMPVPDSNSPAEVPPIREIIAERFNSLNLENIELKAQLEESQLACRAALLSLDKSSVEHRTRIAQLEAELECHRTCRWQLESQLALAHAEGVRVVGLIQDGVKIYQSEYLQELESCDNWIKWCDEQKDTHGQNFHQGKRGALIYHNIILAKFLDARKELSPKALSTNLGKDVQQGVNKMRNA